MLEKNYFCIDLTKPIEKQLEMIKQICGLLEID